MISRTDKTVTTDRGTTRDFNWVKAAHMETMLNVSSIMFALTIASLLGSIVAMRNVRWGLPIHASFQYEFAAPNFTNNIAPAELHRRLGLAE